MIRLTALIEVQGQAPRALTHESNTCSLIIGRDGSADFQIPLSTISRQHARINLTDQVYVIEDLGSTHGTQVNGKRVEKGEKKVLRDNDLIELARARITAHIETQKVAASDPSEATQAIAAKAVEGILGRLGEARSEGPYFRVLCGPNEGARFSLGGNTSEWVLGRSKDCEFVLNDPNVSRRHAQVKKDWNGYTIGDLGSKNGVIINDKQIQKPRRLRDKDEVVIGPIRLVFIDPDADLLDALKDVPGFAIEDPAAADDDEALGAPEGEAPSEENAGEGEPPLVEPPPASPPEVGEEPDLSAIDPELLKPVARKFPIELLVVGLGVLLLLGIGGAIAFFVL